MEESKSQVVRLKHHHQPSWASKVLVAMLVLAAVSIVATMASGLWANRTSLVKKDQYQAVFLTNGQVYFGKVRSGNSQFLTLKDVYYIQSSQATQQSQAQTTNLSLIKLGEEIHGPEAEMYIARDQVLFWENLKDDGKVVQTIKNNAR